MGKKRRPSARKENKYDTMSLIQNVSQEDMAEFDLDDIMQEFGAEPKDGLKFGAVAPLIPANQKAEQTATSAELLKEINEEAFEVITEAIPENPEDAIVDQIQQAIDLELNRDPEMTAPDSVIQLVQEEQNPPVQDLGDPELNMLFQDKKIRLVPQEENQPAEPEIPETTEPPAEPEDPAEEEAVPAQPNKQPKAPKAPKTPKQPKQPKLKVLKEPKPEPVPDAGLTFKKYAKAIRPAQNKGRAVLFLLLISVVLTLINEMELSSAAFLASNQLLSKILLGIMALCALLSLDVIRSGIKGITSLRFNANSMIVLTFLITAIDAILCTNESTLPFCAVICLQFYFANWGNTLRIVSVRRSLKILQKPQEEPKAVGALENTWKRGSAAVVAGDANVDEHVRGLLGSNLTDRWMGVYVPVMLVLSLILGVIVRIKTGNSLTWAWSSMLICSLPVGAFICYYHPFAALAGRLMKEGAAVSGWAGAEKLADAKGILVKDDDIFPTESVSLNGMKLYNSSFNVAQVTGYAAAVMETSQCGLTPLFQELRASNNGKMFTVDQFRIYEGGGYGAEIGGDVILVGSLRFMQLMGVYMREGVKIRNGVYLAINKEMCAVFALNYAPAGRVRKSLRRIEEASRLAPVFATRDFLITPALVHERYKIPAENLEFPGVEERSRLFGIRQVPPNQQGAVMTKSGFSAFAGVVTGSGILRTVTRYGTVISIVGGVLGLGLMFFLTYLGAQAVSAMNVLLFPLLWSLPVFVLSGWVKRY